MVKNNENRKDWNKKKKNATLSVLKNKTCKL